MSDVSSLHRPVSRPNAAALMGLLVVSFGVTVVVTRLYLELAGYPQLGGGEFHFAHALWGGVLLIGGAVLPLVWANRWVLTVAALASGIGIGLFVDEVAPIIYLVFLGLLWVARRVAQQGPAEAYATTYRVLDGLAETADGDLTPHRRAELVEDLDSISTDAARPDFAELARGLAPMVASLAPTEPRRPRRLASP